MTKATEALIGLIRWYLLAHVLIAILADFWLQYAYGPDATISYLMRQWFDRWGMLPYLFAFGLGALFFHLLAPK